MIDYSASGGAPAGKKKAIHIQVPASADLTNVRATAAGNRGAVWYILGEPNKFTLSAGVAQSVEALLPALHDLYEAIKGADPTALITSPSVINWDYTCTGCGGFASGHEWMATFISQYQFAYGQMPPIDIWAIDVFPLDWTSFPTVRSDVVIAQLQAFRSYLDLLPARGEKPIWVTEFGLHWGWSGMTRSVPGCNGLASPTGVYETDRVKTYLREVFSWLDANSSIKKIEKLFILSTYYDITKCNDASYAGMSLFNGPTAGSGLTPVGVFVRDWILGVRN